MKPLPSAPPADRDLDHTHPIFRRPVDLWLFDARAAFPRYEFRLTETKRSIARQRYLYGLGREYPNPDCNLRMVKVIWTLETMHRLGCAVDWVPYDRVSNLPMCNPTVYAHILNTVPPERYGLELLRDAEGSVSEWPHLQLRGGQLTALQAGVKWDNAVCSSPSA